MSEMMSNGEVARQIAELKSQVAAGFSGTHGRLDKVNGQLDAHREKLGQHATALAEHRVKLSNLNRHVFDHNGREHDEAPTQDTTESVPITRRDLWVAVGTLGAAAAAVKWLPAIFAAGSQAP